MDYMLMLQCYSHACACELERSCWLQERLDAQKREAASNPDYGKTYKAQATKEERQTKRKEIVANIGAPCLPGFRLEQPYVMMVLVPALHALSSAALRCCSGTQHVTGSLLSCI